MATQTVDSHQTSTSDEETEKFSEAVKVTEHINLSSSQDTVHEDRERGKADNLRIPDSTLSTSEEKPVDIIEVKKTDETPVVELPILDNVKQEQESNLVAEIPMAAAADETLHDECPSTKPVGGEATELPVIAFLEKSIKEFDVTDNVNSPPEEQPTVGIIEREAQEKPAVAFAQSVVEQPTEAVGLPKLREESLGDIIDSQEKEKPGANVQSETEVAEKVKIVFVPIEEVEEKKPKIIDNPELSVVADSGKGSVEANEETVTKCVSVEKEPHKEPETVVPEEFVEPPKKEAQPTEFVLVEEQIEVVAKENFETVEPPVEKEKPIEVQRFKGLEELIAKEIRGHEEVLKEKKQASNVEVETWQESREVIETKSSESVEIPQGSEFQVEGDPAKKQVVIEKETNKSIKPPKNKEQPDEVISQKESIEVTSKEISASFGPLKNKEETDESFSVTESGEAKEKETNDSTLGSEEIGKLEKEVIEVKDGIGESPKTNKNVQDTYVEAEAVIDEKPLAPKDDTSPPIEGKIQEEEGIDKQDLVGQVEKSGPIEDFVKGPEKKQPTIEFVSVEKEPKEEPETTGVPEESVEPPNNEAQPIEVVPAKEPVEVFAKEIIGTVEAPTEKEQPVDVGKEISEVVTSEVTEKVEPPTKKEQLVVIEKETSEVVVKEVIEAFQPSMEKEHPVVMAKETSESIEPVKNKQQPDEVNSKKEPVEIIAQEVSASFDPPENNEQADKGFPETESGKRLDEEHPPKESISVENEPREEPETTPVLDLFVESPKKEEQTIEVLTVEEQVEVITKEIIETTESPTEKEQHNEVHHLKESREATETEFTEPAELPKEKEEIDVHPLQESRKMTAEEISEIAEIPKENESLTEVHPVKELEVIVEGTGESIEPLKNKERPDEVLSHKELLEVIEKEASASLEPSKNKEQPHEDEVLSQTESLKVIAKEVSASFEPPKNKEQADEGFPVTEFGELKGKETTNDSTLGSEEVLKQQLEVIEVKDSVGEIPELTKHVQDTYMEVETVKDEKALAPEDDINPPTEEEKIQEEEAQYAVESDEQVSIGPVAKYGLIEGSGKGLEKEQLDTTCVPELSVETPKKEELVQVLPVEQVEVIKKNIIEAVELTTQNEQLLGVHPIKGSEVVEKEITEPKELPKEEEQTAEVQPVQESKEVITEKISDFVENSKESELLIEVQPVKELEVVAEDTSESIEPPKNKEQPNEVPHEKESEVIAKEISESFVPPTDTDQANEGLSVTESVEVGAKETSVSKLSPEEVEKQEPEVTKIKDGKEELPEITNHVENNDVEVESVKDEKSLVLGDGSTPPLGVGQIHKEEEPCTGNNVKQDSVDQEAQPSVELVAHDFFPHDVKEDEKKELSKIDVVAKLSEVEAPAVKKVEEENEEKIVKTEKADEDKYENIQELTLPEEEFTPRNDQTAAVVAEKSIDDQKAGEVDDLIAETKVEDSSTDEKSAPVEGGNGHVNESPKEPQESELEVKDKETVIIEGEVPKVNDKKQAPSKPSHKHSHNILSKVKQSLVKAKKAIIGKSPSSKTLSSEARDDIKVK